MALSASAWASIPVYRQYIILRPYGSALWPMLGLECCGPTDYSIKIMSFNTTNKQEVQDALTRTVERVMDSPIVQAGIKKRLKKISDNISDTFERKDIVEFFAELDKEFEAKLNHRNLERSFDKNSSELLKKSELAKTDIVNVTAAFDSWINIKQEYFFGVVLITSSVKINCFVFDSTGEYAATRRQLRVEYLSKTRLYELQNLLLLLCDALNKLQKDVAHLYEIAHYFG
ncbi:hypothetical protein C1645_840724 [Glomus cerebriforme]|uniref:Uncharacterized protein n=1 Tax=Glomus cerebriforme TaxID=658196 RepID=A0A397S0H4_9GLOM|nr:hypothetical protein C1645_840724 [Glomus cerebriforme]